MFPGCTSMGRPPAGQRQRAKGRLLGQNGFAIFNAQDVVGGAQQVAHTGCQVFCRFGPGDGVGHAQAQFFTNQRLYFLPQQDFCRRQQPFGIRALCPESQSITPQGSQQRHPRRRKLLRRGTGIGRRQRYHQIRPGHQCSAHAHGFRQNGYTAALDGTAAHANGNAARPAPTHRGQLRRVPVVKRIVLGNNTCKFHAPLLLCKNCAILRLLSLKIT